MDDIPSVIGYGVLVAKLSMDAVERKMVANT